LGLRCWQSNIDLLNIIDDETIKVFHTMELRDKIATQMKEKD
jgi:hypothetical protein